ncbi:hypothetical protein F5J12DRAFT_283788 [Pisolithus orientalis]|uniref:uncharacterized protein n=1 Tax=Pisolithus orientalis TaxID=936130 RepID=UPI002223FD38|nr:uncharacterized protein F5J12DRAFT_283788 [Pisolithus orientalis]KAI5998906.1 hypothetical protein F5J12DRAFT_283788 [Pisolithus orientalis]
MHDVSENTMRFAEVLGGREVGKGTSSDSIIILQDYHGATHPRTKQLTSHFHPPDIKHHPLLIYDILLVWGVGGSSLLVCRHRNRAPRGSSFQQSFPTTAEVKEVLPSSLAEDDSLSSFTVDTRRLGRIFSYILPSKLLRPLCHGIIYYAVVKSMSPSNAIPSTLHREPEVETGKLKMEV